MTDIVNPSPNRVVSAYQTAEAISKGGNVAGYVVPGNEPTDIALDEGTIDETQFNAFAETSSATSLDVTIDAGEAFVVGTYAATDETHTVNLEPNVSNQMVYVASDKVNANTVQIDREELVPTFTKKIPLFSFDTDANGVTNVTDHRIVGQQYYVRDDGHIHIHSGPINLPTRSDLSTADTSQGNFVYVDGNGPDSQGLYFRNGSSWRSVNGVDYSQPDMPSNTSAATLWYETDTGILYMANGSTYKPLNGVENYYETDSFTESSLIYSSSPYDGVIQASDNEAWRYTNNWENPTGIALPIDPGTTGPRSAEGLAFNFDDYGQSAIRTINGNSYVVGNNRGDVYLTANNANTRVNSNTGGGTWDGNVFVLNNGVTTSASTAENIYWTEGTTGPVQLTVGKDDDDGTGNFRIQLYSNRGYMGRLYWYDNGSSTQPRRYRWQEDTTTNISAYDSDNTDVDIRFNFYWDTDTLDIEINGATYGVFNIDSSGDNAERLERIYIQRDYNGTNSAEGYVDDVYDWKTYDSGTYYVRFDNPAQVRYWDRVLEQSTDNGETIQIDVEESTDGGSTWTTAHTDIDSVQDISSIDSGNLVRLAVTMSRTAGNPSPTFDYAAQQLYR